jgi:hypothetical protein
MVFPPPAGPSREEGVVPQRTRAMTPPATAPRRPFSPWRPRRPAPTGRRRRPRRALLRARELSFSWCRFRRSRRFIPGLSHDPLALPLPSRDQVQLTVEREEPANPGPIQEREEHEFPRRRSGICSPVKSHGEEELEPDVRVPEVLRQRVAPRLLVFRWQADFRRKNSHGAARGRAITPSGAPLPNRLRKKERESITRRERKSMR